MDVLLEKLDELEAARNAIRAVVHVGNLVQQYDDIERGRRLIDISCLNFVVTSTILEEADAELIIFRGLRLRGDDESPALHHG